MAKTIGLDWKEVENSVATIQTLRGEVGRIRAELAQTVGDEWAHGMGSTIQDFANEWQNVRSKMVEMELKLEQLQAKNQVILKKHKWGTIIRIKRLKTGRLREAVSTLIIYKSRLDQILSWLKYRRYKTPNKKIVKV